MSSPLVVLTREPGENRELSAALSARRARVMEIPCVRIEHLTDARPLVSAVRALGADDLLVVTSVHGSRAVLAAVPARDIRAPIVAIGEATARPFRDAGIEVRVPQGTGGDALARETMLPAGRVLIARSDIGRHEPAEILRGRGAAVDEVVAYRNVPRASGDVAAVRKGLRGGDVVIVFASPSAVDGLLTAFEPEELRRARFVAIGPQTATRVRERLATEAVVPERPEAEALLAAIELASQGTNVARP